MSSDPAAAAVLAERAPLKVLMVGAGSPPPTFIARLMATLGTLGAEVTQLPELAERRWIGGHLARRGFTRHLPAEMHRLARDADVIHYQWPGHHAAWGVLARQHDRPSLLSLRGRQINVDPYLPDSAANRRRLARSFEAVDGVHAVSAHILGEAHRLGLRARREWVVRPAVDTRFFTPAATPPAPGRFRIAMVGAIIWRKGYECALLALRRLVDRGVDAELAIVGDGAERDRVEYTIADLGLSGRVELLGKRSPEQIRTVLQESSAFVLTSLSEGIANSAIEAMASGLPVVSTLAGGMEEAIDDGVDGFLVPARSCAGVADRLLALARDPELCASVGGRARARAVAEFDLRDQGRRLYVYRSLAGAP